MGRILAVGFALFLSSAHADYSAHPRVPALLDKLRADHGFNAAEIDAVVLALKDAQLLPELIESEQKAKEKTLTWDAYRRIHLSDANVRNGARFLSEYRDLLARAEAQYGVAPSIIAAILGVETKYGSFTGKHRTLDALATQGFDHPTRTPFFFGELVEFFAMCRDFGFSPTEVKGSYAGAVGAAQFMPSNYRRLAVDFDADGTRNLWALPDAIGSIGNYLVNYAPAKSWQRGLPLIVPVALGDAPGSGWPLNAKALTHRAGDYFRVGVKPVIGIPPETPVGLLELSLTATQPDGPLGKEYWFGLNNFYSVMSYNPRVYYAMAVTQLASELQRAAHGNVTAAR
ncbi:MAG TPA: lytic murein transglycosylase [Verrucomicrobiae bacterium]|nr:lytic murein transglycosylase [Verrucomicrobiae bacterium]